MVIWKKNDAIDILNDISENVTLVQLMDSYGNLNHAISIVGHCIFDSNYKKAIFLTQGLLDLICSSSIFEELVATFRSVFYAGRKEKYKINKYNFQQSVGFISIMSG